MLLREAVEDRNVGSASYVVTIDGVPTFAQMFLKKALRIGS